MAADTSGKFYTTQGRSIIAPDGTEVLLKGIGLGMWLVPEGYQFRFGKHYDRPRTIEGLTNKLLGPAEAARFWDNFREMFITEADIAAIAQEGFNSIRIPFNYKMLSPEALPGVLTKAGFRWMDRVIEWSAKYNIGVILDMHCAPGGQTGRNIDDSWDHPWLYRSPEDQARTVEIWKAIALRYKDNTAVIGYDLLNEPIPNDDACYFPELEPLYKMIVAAVREVDTNHIIFLEGANWATNFSIFGEPFDGNLAYSFHKYWNENTTASIQSFLDYSQKYNVPLWNGETGENKPEWYRDSMTLMSEHKIGWNFWCWKKMSNNSSPYTIQDPPYWNEILEYTNGGAKPSIEHAQAAFRGLVENTALDRCSRNASVLDALFLR